jgi:hypothetical protein
VALPAWFIPNNWHDVIYYSVAKQNTAGGGAAWSYSSCCERSGDPSLLIENGARAIGIGMWLALIMAFNVWFIIWPNQKKALGIVTVEPAAKAAAAKMAGLTSRINTMLSIPMLYCMAAQSHGGF